MFRLILTTILLSMAAIAVQAAVYQAPEDFLQEVFQGPPPEPAVIWMTGERKKAVSEILGHRYPSLRVRYWAKGNRSAWILDEIGKELPITTGVVVSDSHIETIKVLEFRESRGWEVRHDFFTDQFKDARLDEKRQLSRNIDGISGATLSVRAMKKMATLALYLDSNRIKKHVTPAP